MIKRVFIAYDGSASAESAIDWYFSKMHQSETFVYVYYQTPPLSPSYTMVLGEPMTLNANDFQKQVTEQLRKCKDVEEKFKTKIKAFTLEEIAKTLKETSLR